MKVSNVVKTAVKLAPIIIPIVKKVILQRKEQLLKRLHVRNKGAAQYYLSHSLSSYFTSKYV